MYMGCTVALLDKIFLELRVLISIAAVSSYFEGMQFYLMKNVTGRSAKKYSRLQKGGSAQGRVACSIGKLRRFRLEDYPCYL